MQKKSEVLMEGYIMGLKKAGDIIENALLEMRSNELASFKPYNVNEFNTTIDPSLIKRVYVLKKKYSLENGGEKSRNQDKNKYEKLVSRLSRTPIYELKRTKEAAQLFLNQLRTEKGQSKNGFSVSEHGEDEYKNMTMLLSSDLKSGCAINGRDLISVFGGSGSSTYSVIACAVEKNGRTLDAYTVNDYLPNLYAKFGFQEYGRTLFDPSYLDDDTDMPRDLVSAGTASREKIVKKRQKPSDEENRLRPDVTLMGRNASSRRSVVKDFYKNYMNDKESNMKSVNFNSEKDFDEWDEIEKRRNRGLKQK